MVMIHRVDDEAELGKDLAITVSHSGPNWYPLVRSF